jgi:hypothetical protein
MANDEDNKANPTVALVTGLLVLGFVVFVALVPKVNSNPFIQGVTGLIVMAGIAVVLFSAVPSSATIKTIGAVSGAAAFFLLGIEPLERFIFPKHTMTITGTIYYVDSTIPVEGVVVRIPETSSKVLTGKDGDFILPNVSWGVKKLTATSGGEDYEIILNDEKKYPLIKQPPGEKPTTAKEAIAVERWEVRTKNGCPTPIKGVTSELYLLNETFKRPENYTKLYVQVNAPPETEIVHAEKLVPPPGKGGNSFDSQTQNPEGDPRLRKWWIPAEGEEVTVKLAVCLREERKRGGARAAVNLDTKYWFEKEAGNK